MSAIVHLIAISCILSTFNNLSSCSIIKLVRKWLQNKFLLRCLWGIHVLGLKIFYNITNSLVFHYFFKGWHILHFFIAPNLISITILRFGELTFSAWRMNQAMLQRIPRCQIFEECLYTSVHNIHPITRKLFIIELHCIKYIEDNLFSINLKSEVSVKSAVKWILIPHYSHIGYLASLVQNVKSYNRNLALVFSMTVHS